MYTLGEGGGKLNIYGLDHSGSETFNYRKPAARECIANCSCSLVSRARGPT